MTVTFQVDTLSNLPLWIRVKKQHILMIILNKMCRSDAPWYMTICVFVDNTGLTSSFPNAHGWDSIGCVVPRDRSCFHEHGRSLSANTVVEY